MKTFHLHTKNPNRREIQIIAKEINSGAIVVIPTDTVYAIACKLTNKAGINKICRITGKKEKQAKMTIICSDLKQVSNYTMSYNNDVFKTLKRYSPGPYVYILNANKFVQKYFKNNKSEIGIRISGNEIIQSLLEFMDEPLITTSLNRDNIAGYYTDPEKIEDDYSTELDIMINAGPGSIGESTILDCTGNEIEVIREGIGKLS